VAVLVWQFLQQHHVSPGEEFDPEYTEDDALTALRAYVADALGEADVELRTICELPGRGLVQAAQGASMLVVGARGLGGFKELLIGSVSRYCLHHATCPVAVVHRGGSGSPGGDAKVVVGIDGSEASRRALLWAADEAARRGAPLEVVHAWEPPIMGPYPYMAQPSDFSRFEQEAQRVLDQAVGEVATGVTTTQVLALGSAANALLSAGEDADLVVVGARGATGVERLFLGSTSSQVVHHAGRPVVVIPSEVGR
jgi:nucleotide-binding universal stress UspA family protein